MNHLEAEAPVSVEPRNLGKLEGKIQIEGDLKDPLPDDIAAAFGMESESGEAG